MNEYSDYQEGLTELDDILGIDDGLKYYRQLAKASDFDEENQF